MKQLFSNFLLIFSLIAFSQNDQKAIELLERVSSKIDLASSYKVEFSYHADENIDQKQKGDVMIKNDNYVLNFLGIKQICDSKFVYTIVAENKEVIVSKISESNNIILNPSDIFKFYRTGYYVKEIKVKDEPSLFIKYLKLTPVNENTEISHLLVAVNTKKNEITKVIEFGKNNSKISLEINNIYYNLKFDKNIFIFNKNDYPEYYIDKL